MVSVREVWERRGALAKFLWLLLLPLSLFYLITVQLRNALYSLGWLRSARLPRPVVSVGNLTVGGTGKTPTCLWLAEELQNQGLKVGILSRGYRRRETQTVVLRPESAALSASDNHAAVSKVGDEPLMMAGLYGQTVGIGKDREAAAAELLRQCDVDVFILDDGFQHRRVKRDVDLLLLGADCSGWILPVGPFREPRRSYRRGDFFLVTGAQENWRTVLAADRKEAMFTASLQPVCLLSLSAERRKEFPLSLLYRSKILTVAGVADPSGLYRIIHEWEGEIVETLEFPDHHNYSTRDWQQINRVSRMVDLIVTTEKDILKLMRFPFAKDRLLALRVAMSLENGADLVQSIITKINQARSLLGREKTELLKEAHR